MVRVVIYLMSFLGSLLFLWSLKLRGLLPEWLQPFELAYGCALIGGLGGCVYCLRGVYLNHSVRDQWDNRWIAWYLIRPIVSGLVGIVAFVFLKAGLLILDAQQDEDSNTYGFFALAFIAGLNVDRFLLRIEELAQSAWGIRPSRSAERSKSNKS